MCDCHPWTLEEKKLWTKEVRHAPNTFEDWKDLHDSIEGFRRRKMERYLARQRKPAGTPAPDHSEPR